MNIKISGKEFVLCVYITLIVSIFTTPSVLAADLPLKASAWAKEHLSAVEKRQGNYPEKIIAVKGLGESGLPIFPEIDRSGLVEKSYFKTLDIRNLQWDLRLNSKDDSELRDLGFIQKISSADTLLIERGDGRWGVRYKGQDDSSNFETEFKLNPKAKADDAAIALLSLFAYDGVILDVAEKFVLVGSTAKILSQPNLQAMALTESANKVSLKGAPREGAGLLSLVDISGGYAVFEITLLGRGMSNLPIGTKVIIERRSK